MFWNWDKPTEKSKMKYRNILLLCKELESALQIWCSITPKDLIYFLFNNKYLGFLVAQMVESACNAGDLSSDPWVGKITWRREWLSTPVFLLGESHGQKSLVGYSPWIRKESDTTEVTEYAQEIIYINTLVWSRSWTHKKYPGTQNQMEEKGLTGEVTHRRL